jgi:hypothetical protein
MPVLQSAESEGDYARCGRCRQRQPVTLSSALRRRSSNDAQERCSEASCATQQAKPEQWAAGFDCPRALRSARTAAAGRRSGGGRRAQRVHGAAQRGPAINGPTNGRCCCGGSNLGRRRPSVRSVGHPSFSSSLTLVLSLSHHHPCRTHAPRTYSAWPGPHLAAPCSASTRRPRRADASRSR